MLPKVVATDLDGTLLRSDRQVSRRTLTALGRLEAAGVTLVLVTGRPIRWLEPVLAQTGRRGVAVGGNGGYVLDGATSELLGEWPLTPSALADTTDALRGRFPSAVFGVERRTEFLREPGYETREPTAATVPFDELIAEPAYKLLARAPDAEPAAFYAAARTVLEGIATPTHSGYSGLLEISAAGVTKATGLQWVTDQHGATAADVLAFGDMPNDVPMLSWAGRSVVVAGAHPDARAAADEVTGDNDDDGVAAYLEALLDLS